MTVLTDCRRTFPHLVDIRGGTCTIIAFPGDDLQAALDALPDDGGKLCLAAGTYPVRTPLTIGNKLRVVIDGVGPATVLVADRHEAVLIATNCHDIEVTHLRVESAVPHRPSPPGEKHLLGALTFLGGNQIRVRDCQVRCPDAYGRAQSGIYVAPFEGGLSPGRVEIRGNRLEIGAMQVGVLIASALVSTIVDNEISIALPRRGEVKKAPVNRYVARELGRFVARHLDVEGEGRSIKLSDGTELRVGGRTEIRQLVADWARQTSAGRLARERSPRHALEHFIIASLVEPQEVRVGASSTQFLAASTEGVRGIGQGIVVGGPSASYVRIEGNTVAGAIQGIHVGLSKPGQEQATAKRVVVSGNFVVCLVPYFWMRQRHAIYVGNVNNLTIVDNRAFLVRTGNSDKGTSVDAVRVWGLLGPYLQIRGLELTGDFRFGVIVRDTTPPKLPKPKDPPPMVRHISDVLNLDGAQAVTAPTTVTTERCVP